MKEFIVRFLQDEEIRICVLIWVVCAFIGGLIIAVDCLIGGCGG